MTKTKENMTKTKENMTKTKEKKMLTIEKESKDQDVEFKRALLLHLLKSLC